MKIDHARDAIRQFLLGMEEGGTRSLHGFTITDIPGLVRSRVTVEAATPGRTRIETPQGLRQEDIRETGRDAGRAYADPAEGKEAPGPMPEAPAITGRALTNIMDEFLMGMHQEGLLDVGGIQVIPDPEDTACGLVINAHYPRGPNHRRRTSRSNHRARELGRLTARNMIQDATEKAIGWTLPGTWRKR